MGGFKNLLSPASLYSRVNRWQILKPKMSSNDRKGFCALQRCRLELSLVWKLLPFYLPYLIRSNFIKTTYDISLDSQISFLPLGFSPTEVVSCLSSVGNLNPKVRRQRNLREGIERIITEEDKEKKRIPNNICICLFFYRLRLGFWFIAGWDSPSVTRS